MSRPNRDRYLLFIFFMLFNSILIGKIFAQSSITLTKSSTTSSYQSPNQIISYDYLVTNTGTNNLTSLSISDNKIDAVNIHCPSSSLSVGASTTCTGSYTTSQVDVDAGSLSNTATATASAFDANNDKVTSNSSTVKINATLNPLLTLSKSASPTTFTKAGETITYTYAVANAGNETINGISISDNKIPTANISCINTVLAPGSDTQCTGTYTILQTDLNAGSVSNTATATGTTNGGTAVNSNSPTNTITAVLKPALTLSKAATPTQYDLAGQSITYTYTVTNSGNQTLSALSITDNKIPTANITCNPSSIDPGNTSQCTGVYKVTQADLDNGSLTNTARATAKSPQNSSITSANTTATATAILNPKLSLAKSTNKPNFNAPGQYITYSYQVTNTGNTTINTIKVTDNRILSAISCPVSTLAPNVSTTCSAVYIATQADVDAGGVTNTGTVTGKSPQGTLVEGSATMTLPAIQNPALSLTKSKDTNSYAAAGTVLNFSYIVKNTGNQTLNTLTISDDKLLPANISCPATQLAVNASTSCTGTYLTTQADVDAGFVTNIATATGKNQLGTVAASTPSTVTVYSSAVSGINLTKTSSTAIFDGPNQTISYSYKVENTGQKTLSSLTIVDSKIPEADINCPQDTLAPAETITCTADYSTLQGDVDAGGVTNRARALVSTPNGLTLRSNSETVTVPAEQNPSISMTKASTTPDFNAPNQEISYTYTVTNTGNGTLSNITINDDKIPSGFIDCQFTRLAPAASTTCTASYQVTQADIDAGSVQNTAKASGKNGVGTVVTSSQSSVIVPAVSQPALSIAKSTTSLGFNSIGEVISYNYLVKNSGNTTLSNLVVNDNKISGAISCEVTTLAPYNATTCTAQYTTTQDDLDAGEINNVATASGKDPQGVPITSPPSDVTVPAKQTQGITLIKTADVTSYSTAGTVITYSYKVGNTGNVTLSAIDVTDPHIGLSAISCPSTTLAPAASTMTCSATYTTTAADVQAGSIKNKATVLATSPVGQASATSSLTIQAAPQPAISINKTANVGSFSAAGTLITYFYEVRNTGNLPLNTLLVTDPHLGLSAISCPVSTLDRGAQTTCTATYTTTAADVAAGFVFNTGKATADSSEGSVTASSSLKIPLSSDGQQSFSFTKSASIGSYDSPNTTIIYSYLVQNTGQVDFNFSITDPHSGLSAISCPTTTLVVGATTTCTASYVTTQADVDVGAITNTAVVSVGSAHALSTVTIPGIQAPSISLTKSSSTTSFDAPSQSLKYSYLIENTGNQTLAAISLTDNKIPANNLICTVDSLAPHASTTCIGFYETDQADVDAGSVSNTANVTALSPQETMVNAQANYTVNSVLNPKLQIIKSTTTTTFNAVGQTLTYSYLIKNTGNNTVNNLSVSDSRIANVNCQITSLAPDLSTSCTGTYVTTLADLDAGQILNTATVSGQNEQGTPVVSAPSTVSVPAQLQPGLSLEKSTTAGPFSAPGQTIPYTYKVTNTGNDTLNNIQIRDNKLATTQISCILTTLAPQESTTCSGIYTTTQGDVDAAGVTNTAVAAGKNNQGTQALSPIASASVAATLSPSISLTKKALSTSYSAPNQLVNYSYTVTNTGNNTLSNISINDDKISADNLSCNSTSLAPGASTTCSGVYVTSQADIDAGSISNKATASSKTPQGVTVNSAEATASVPAVLTPSISLQKSTNLTNYNRVGQTIPYTYLVKNTGNDTLNNITIADNKVAAGITCLATSLAPGSSTLCTGTYTVTLADVDAGVLTNTAEASGKNNQGTTVTSISSSVTLVAIQAPAITLTKKLNSNSITSFDTVGQTLSYDYIVTNTGNDTLNSIAISDNKIAAAKISCPVTSLAPTMSTICTGTYKVVQADIDGGGVTNIASASGTNFQGTRVVSSQSTVTVPAVQHPALTLAKSLNPNTYNKAGASITYSYTIQNTGNTTLTTLTIADSKITAANISCSSRTVAPTRTVTCQGTYTTTQADVDGGSVTNIATATGKALTGTFSSNQAQATATAIQLPALSLTKSSITANYNEPGDVLTYRYIVKNTGNNTIKDIAISDNLILSGINCSATTLAPNATTTCTGSYTTKQQDVDSGQVTNTAKVSGTDPTGASVTSPPSSVTVPAVVNALLKLTKTTSATAYDGPDQPIPYIYTVVNNGNVTVTALTISDNKMTSADISCDATTLAPTAQTTCKGTYLTTQADVDAGSLTNLATASGVNGALPVNSNSANTTIKATLNSALSLVKSTTTTSFDAVGQTIPYQYAVTNTGNTTLTVSITDSKIPAASISCKPETIAPKASTNCSGIYTTTQADIDEGFVTNTSKAKGRDELGNNTISSPSSVTVEAVQSPGISLSKALSPTTYDAAGISITYTYTVTNSGNTTLNNIVIDDDHLSANSIECQLTTVEPGDSTTCSGRYFITQADVDAGSVTNKATATGKNLNGSTITSAIATATAQAQLKPGISLTKASSTVNFNGQGQSVNYIYTVTNSGNETLNNISISDDKVPSGITCTADFLAPSGTTECQGVYVTTQQDVDAGLVVNDATASGQTSMGKTVISEVASVTVPAVENPMLNLIKTASAPTYDAAGKTIDYSYLVTNTGNNTLNNIAISDDKITSVVCPVTTLAPGADTTCTGVYTVTQSDVDEGSITNIAIVSGTNQSGTVVNAKASATVNAVINNLLTLLKTVTTSSYDGVGQTINYNYAVTNAGNTTITNLSISDNKITAANIACPVDSLEPQQTVNCTGSYSSTQADVDNGSISNKAHAEGRDPFNTAVQSSESTAVVNAILAPSLALTKSASPSSYSLPGELISYTYLVTNNGNQTIASLAITDDRIPSASIVCPQIDLAPTDSTTCQAVYLTTQADVDAGSIVNNAQATGQSPQLTPIASPISTVTVSANLAPALSLAKSTTATDYSAVNQPISYSYQVTNTGNQTLNNLSIADDKISSAQISCPVTTLAPNASTTCSGTYLIAQADLDAGAVTNAAYAIGTTDQGNAVQSTPSLVSVQALLTPALHLIKTSQSQTFGLLGQKITYQYQVQNTGNNSLSGISISDDKLLAGISCQDTALTPGQSTSCSGVYTVTQADIDAKAITNIATASGNSEQGVPVVSNSATLTLNYLPPGGSLSLVKTASVSQFTLPGTPISYSYVVTNTGVSILDSISLVDSQLGPVSCPLTLLNPGDSMTCSASYLTTFEDMKIGLITNLATVTALAPDGSIIQAKSSATVTLDAGFIRKETMSAIKTFLNARAQLVLTDDPDRRRILNRLSLRTQSCGGKPQGSFQPNNGRVVANAAFSLSELCMPMNNWDLWAEGHGTYFEQDKHGIQRHGDFGIGYLGFDYLLNSSVVIGVLGEGDTLSENGNGPGFNKASGQGWMAGPYLSARLLPDLYLHTRAAWGRSDNKINVFNLYNDSFKTVRSLYNAELIGDWYYQRWRLSPTVGLSYYTELQKSFKNAIGVAIPGQTISLGQFNIGPEISRLFRTESNKEITLRLSLQGLFNFAYSKDNDFENAFIPVNPVSGRVKLGAEFRGPSGLSITPMVAYEGFGSDYYNALSGQLQLSIPLN